MDHKEQPSDTRYGELAENKGGSSETVYNIFKSSRQNPHYEATRIKKKKKNETQSVVKWRPSGF
jgi:hypothetical protein